MSSNAPTADIRCIDWSGYESFIRAVDAAFGNSTHPDRLKQERIVFEPDRAFLAFDGEGIVGTTAALSTRLTAPGGASLGAGAIAYVAVMPTHRRRGILRAMMRRQLDEIRGRGEPLAVLWPSESGIYGRFGFGNAVPLERWSIPRRYAGLAKHAPVGEGQVELLTAEAARPHMQAVYERVRKGRPGMPSRGARWWEFNLMDPEFARTDATPLLHAIYFESDRADGYASYRIEQKGRERRLFILELVPVTERARGALWRYCFGMDLVNSITSWNHPPDDPLPLMLQDVRRLERRPGDGLWLRLMDVPEALARRTYASPGRLVLRVEDDFCPWNAGMFALEASSSASPGPGSATGKDPNGDAGSAGTERATGDIDSAGTQRMAGETDSAGANSVVLNGRPEVFEVACERTKDVADLHLDIRDLSAVYLGGWSFRSLCEAGRVEELRPGASKLADRLFGTDRKPWCLQEF